MVNAVFRFATFEWPLLGTIYYVSPAIVLQCENQLAFVASIIVISKYVQIIHFLSFRFPTSAMEKESNALLPVLVSSKRMMVKWKKDLTQNQGISCKGFDGETLKTLSGMTPWSQISRNLEMCVHLLTAGLIYMDAHLWSLKLHWFKSTEKCWGKKSSFNWRNVFHMISVTSGM